MSTVTPLVAVLVLAAAVMHATWNALVKAGGDKVVMTALVNVGSGVICLPGLFFVPLPEPAAWPFLALSVAVHGFYYTTLVNSYRFGDLSQVYPIGRGSSPLIIALGAWAFAAEAMNPLEWTGVLIVSAGIMSLALPNGARRDGELRGIAFALGTACCIAVYSIADGMGVRRTTEPLSYILWLMTIDTLPMLAIVLWLRRGRIVAAFRPYLARGLAGGVVAGLGYGIVIWAMQRAPIAHVSALRETSVILATVIGATLLKEPFGRRRIIAAVLVVAGNVLLRLAG
jgi:drug/metabolite transporter (DMT)-like permease